MDSFLVGETSDLSSTFLMRTGDLSKQYTNRGDGYARFESVWFIRNSIFRLVSYYLSETS